MTTALEDALEVDLSPDAPQAWPTAPVYNFTRPPTPLTSVAIASSGLKNNFHRQAQWCADGTSILTTSEDRSIRIYDAPHDIPNPDLLSPRAFPQPDSILTTKWYPAASLSSPETFCFLASIRDAPLRLIDANTGKVRASYPIVDHRERFVGCSSLAFNPSATKIYCGHENAIEVHDISQPGKEGERLKTSHTRRDKSGQKGIISALAFCTDQSGSYAAGSFGGSVGLYDEDVGRSVGFLDGVLGGGVTQIAFHPLSPTILFVASRRSDFIQVFDTRNPTVPYSSFERPGDTNQRLHFDVDPWGRYLASGDESGTVRIWDIGTMSTQQLYQEKVHTDAIGSVQLHPYRPLLLACSGSRSYLREPDINLSPADTESDTDSDVSSSTSDSSASSIHTPLKRSISDGKPSLHIWSFNGLLPDTTS